MHDVPQRDVPPLVPVERVERGPRPVARRRRAEVPRVRDEPRLQKRAEMPQLNLASGARVPHPRELRWRGLAADEGDERALQVVLVEPSLVSRVESLEAGGDARLHLRVARHGGSPVVAFPGVPLPGEGAGRDRGGRVDARSGICGDLPLRYVRRGLESGTLRRRDVRRGVVSWCVLLQIR